MSDVDKGCGPYSVCAPGRHSKGGHVKKDCSKYAKWLANPEQLDRILVNLLKNAREAIEASGRGAGEVALYGEATGAGGVRLRIRDDGPGVPERLQLRLFQPFAGSGRPGGAGLGLAIARELARAHGGDLLLEDTGPQGSTFLLTLPGL